MCVCVCVVSVIIKHPVLPPCVVDGRSRNPLYYYYYLPGWVPSVIVTVIFPKEWPQKMSAGDNKG